MAALARSTSPKYQIIDQRPLRRIIHQYIAEEVVAECAEILGIPAATVKTRMGLLHTAACSHGVGPKCEETAVRPHLVILAVVMTFVAQDAAAQGVSSGTAFSVAPELLITNQHVVEGCSSVEVISLDGRQPGSITAADADIDLAITAGKRTQGNNCETALS
jgi:S1-C subfamily serine protease